MKKSIILILTMIIVLSFSSCSFSSYIEGILGIDNFDYSTEKITNGIELDSDTAKDITDSVKVLLYCKDPIFCFDSIYDLQESYYDVVLDYLSDTFYVKYTANKKMFQSLADKYPELSVNTLVPDDDFENYFYKFFGGKKKISNKSTLRYTYLDKIESYMLIGKIKYNTHSIKPISISETQNTYKLIADFYDSDNLIGEYSIILMKREESCPYIYKISKLK